MRNTDIRVTKLNTILKGDVELLNRNIKSLCEDSYRDGYEDGVNNGFTWTMVEERKPRECELKLVTLKYIDGEDTDYPTVEYRTTFGYYRKGEWYVEGWPTDEGTVIAWSELPKAYEPKDDDKEDS